jgi:hypothetical protein
MKRHNKFLIGIVISAFVLLLGYGGGAKFSYAQDASTDPNAITTDTASSSLDNTSTSQTSGTDFDAVVTQGEAQIGTNSSDTTDQTAVLADETTSVAETDGNLPPVEVTATDEQVIPTESQPEENLQTDMNQQGSDTTGTDQTQVDQTQGDQTQVDQTASPDQAPTDSSASSSTDPGTPTDNSGQ